MSVAKNRLFEPYTVKVSGQMPMPPFPAPENAAFRVVVQRAVKAYHSGEATAEQAILNAAVNAWYEGHIQGEGACPGCDYRGNLPKQSTRGFVDPTTN